MVLIKKDEYNKDIAIIELQEYKLFKKRFNQLEEYAKDKKFYIYFSFVSMAISFIFLALLLYLIFYLK